VKRAAPVVAEKPSAYCHKCRKWVETRQRVQVFASIDGKRMRPELWTCPACKGGAA
jgi:uncharacterized protein with PIN domain